MYLFIPLIYLFNASITFQLSSDGGGLNVGDLWCVAAAVASACFIIRIEKFSRENDAAELSGVSFMTVTALCAMWIGIDLASPAALLARDGMDAIFSSNNNILMQFVSLMSLPSLKAYIVDPFLSNPWPILYLGAFSTGVCNYLQTVGQRDIAAEKAAIIYSMDPVTTTHPINTPNQLTLTLTYLMCTSLSDVSTIKHPSPCPSSLLFQVYGAFFS